MADADAGRTVGTWTCLLCDRIGDGGPDGYHRHYVDWHWDYRRE